MDAKKDPWSLRRTMSIMIQDDTYRDVINWRSLPKSFLPNNFGLEDSINGGEKLEAKSFWLMVEPDDTIAAVKAYIQEEKGIPFKKQKLLKKEGGVLKDGQTLLPLGIRDCSNLVLRYAPIARVIIKMLNGKTFKIVVEADGTVADVKAVIYEKEGIPCHQQVLIYGKKPLDESKRLVDLGIQYDSVVDLVTRLCGC